MWRLVEYVGLQELICRYRPCQRIAEWILNPPLVEPLKFRHEMGGRSANPGGYWNSLPRLFRARPKYLGSCWTLGLRCTRRLCNGASWAFLTSRQRERDRPRFDCRWVGTGRRETAFAPNWKIKQIHGEQVDELHWRVRGPRFGLSDWTILRGQDIEQATVTGEYDLTVEICADEFVEPNQVGLELRFRWKTWRRNWGHELHFWPIEPAEIPGKTLWDHLNEDFSPRRFETRGHR